MIKLFINLIFLTSIFCHFALANDADYSKSLKLFESGTLIVDVRNKSEWQETGIIPGSKLVQMLTPAMTLRNDFINDLISVIGDDKSIKAGIICKSGGRSSATVAMLKEKGYKNIYNMTEGIVGDETKTGWITRGYPIASCGSECN